MKTIWSRARKGSVVALLLGCGVLLVNRVWANCDTINGPVASAGRTALEKGDVTPLLKWVKKEHEAELRKVFQKALVVRAKGPEAKEMADRLFQETFVRLHRAGEGQPYTGIKDVPLEPIVVLADKALEGGSVDAVIDKLTAPIAEGIRERFRKAVEAKKHADQSVDAGREYVEAYVQYMHYVEGLHSASMATGEHAGEAAGSRTHEGH
ncbi:MAG: hypothetical protein KBE04_00840 [Phycisphaerae bacterium]|nr:hypothetical protein [Phycisphaerae bacterium]